MRIGTWNMQGRWDGRHEHLLESQRCDVWLLTELDDRASLSGYAEARAAAYMASGRRWAGVFARAALDPLVDPHPATAAAVVDGTTFWSSILPWRGAVTDPPWEGEAHAQRTSRTVEVLLSQRPTAPLVWGGDFNHALTGREYAGSKGGREAVLHAMDSLGVVAHTGHLPHQIPELLSIDHIAVSASWKLVASTHVVAEHDGARLSDHDMYVVEVAPE